MIASRFVFGIAVLLVSPLVFAQPAAEPPADTAQADVIVAHTGEVADCATCHVSATPKAGDAELKHCPRPRDVSAEQESEEPDIVIMDALSDIYVPVVFPHKLHASMTDMGVGCATCHHSNPPGRILKCSECHDGPSKTTNLEQPSLKGAYHRQCLNCHREWDHKSDCGICHAKREPGTTPQIPVDPTDIMGMLHPNIESPKEKTYNAVIQEEPLPVTFRHEEHVQLFGMKCVECHREQSCSSCHDEKNHVKHVRLEPHDDCIRCHKEETENDCTYCHTSEPRSGFDHERLSGHALAPYHAKVSCRECHPGRGRMVAADPKCESCHAEDWVPQEFDHTVTGLVLDENHSQLDCIACHPKGMGRPRDCSTCHDDNRTTFPKPEIAKSPEQPETTG